MKPLKLKMQAFGSYGEETLIDFEKVNQNLCLLYTSIITTKLKKDAVWSSGYIA